MSLSNSNRLSDLTYPEAEARLKDGCIALLPCGSTEAHGPHLALRTDVIIGENAALAAAALLIAGGQDALVLPPVSYAVTDFAAAFSGTLTVEPAAAEAWLLEVVRSAMRANFIGTVLCSAHLDPGHLGVLKRVAERASGEGLRVAFPNIVRRKHVARLGEEFGTGACHAGRFETSLVLAAEPNAVRPDIAASLAPNPNSLSTAIAEGKTSFSDAGGKHAYFGWPADATADEGRALYRELGDIFASAARDLVSST